MGQPERHEMLYMFARAPAVAVRLKGVCPGKLRMIAAHKPTFGALTSIIGPPFLPLGMTKQ